MYAKRTVLRYSNRNRNVLWTLFAQVPDIVRVYVIVIVVLRAYGPEEQL